MSISSCSKSNNTNNNGGNAIPTPSSRRTFTLGIYNYENSESLDGIKAVFSSGSSEPYALGIFDSKGKGNSPYHLRFDLNFNTHATGTYIIKTKNILAYNPFEKFMNISVIITDGYTVGTAYVCGNTDLTATITLINSKYHVTIPNKVTLTKSNGSESLPDSFTFTCNDVH